MKVSMRRVARGAAAVELALSMIVIIPVFLYALFLNDLLHYAMGVQEAVTSTVWDYAVLDYAKKPKSSPGGTSPNPNPNPGDEAPRPALQPFVGHWETQHYARFMYCDHESGADSLQNDSPPECKDDERHHKAVAAHVCWLVEGGEQVTCGAPDVSAGASGEDVHRAYMSAYSRGGIIGCRGRSGVQNYLLPKGFLQSSSQGSGGTQGNDSGFSKVNLARERQHTTGGGATPIHDNARQGKWENDKDGLLGSIYMLPEGQMSILVDTWALTKPADLKPGTKEPADQDEEGLYTRVANMYQGRSTKGFTEMRDASRELVQNAVRNKLLNQALSNLDAADDPSKPNLSIHPQSGEPTEEIEQATGKQKYFNSEWRDWERNGNYETNRARGPNYMGCKKAESC